MQIYLFNLIDCYLTNLIIMLKKKKSVKAEHEKNSTGVISLTFIYSIIKFIQ